MGKKSGPLAFLNKKGWHPGNIRNQEKVWKKEQEALAEQKQVEELRKQYEEARQREEMEAMAVSAGVKKKQERLDWMYQGGMVAKQEAQKRADAQLLGEKEVELKAAEETSRADQLSQLPSFYTTDTPASANEMWQRLHGDPMFAIKQQELMARKKIVANPVQMDAIRRSLAEKAKAKAARKAAKAAKKAAKKAKKEKKDKKRKKDATDSSDSDSGSESDRSPKRARVELPPHNGASAVGRSRDADNRDHRPQNGSHSHRDGPKDHRDVPRDYRDRQRDRDEGFRDHRNGHRDHRDRDYRDQRDREYSRRDDRDAEHRSRHRETDRHREEGSHRRQSSPGRDDSAPAKASNGEYGIKFADGRGPEDREEQRKATERRLREAAERKEAEEREKASQRYVRKEYKAGKLSEEEKARRLAEMSGNAEVHEEARWARLHSARKRQEAEQQEEDEAKARAAAANAAPGRHHSDTAKFLTQANKDVYSGADATLADRVGRRKYFSERGGGD